MKINVNQRVRVRLTPLGLSRFRDHAVKVNKQLRRSLLPLDPVLDAEGYYSAILWEIMRDFGDLCYLGGPLPFETLIDIIAEG